MFDSEKSVKILSLEAEGVKKIRAVRLAFSPEGLTIIGGKNRNGKTSVLDSIAFGLGGDKKRPSNLKNDSLAENENPFLRIELSNGIVVERKGKNSSLVVTDSQGKKSGQTLLNAFVSEFALDIESFLNADPIKQRSLILKALGDEEKLAKLNADEKKKFDDRTLKGREVTKAKGFFETLPECSDAPKTRVSREDIAEEYRAAVAKNAEIQDRAEEVERAHKKTTDADLALANAKRIRDDLEKQLEKARQGVDNALQNLEVARSYEQEKIFEASLDSRVDVSEISARLQNIDSENAKIEANEKREKARVDLRSLEKEYSDLSEEIEKIREEKKSVVDAAGANLPGLSWDGEGLVFNGQKWDGMSGAERMIVSTSIARLFSPDCGFVLIDKLEQLDAETLQEFGVWLQDQKLQAIGTRVSTGDECSFILEDGEVKE